MIEKFKNLFKKNKKKEVSEVAVKERETIEQENINVRDNYAKMIEENTKNIEETTNSKNEHNNIIVRNRLKDLENEKAEIETTYERRKQGRVKDIISAYFGQIDKRFANKLFNNDKFGNKLLSFHEKLANKRYKDLPGYIMKNALIILPVAILSVLGTTYVPVLSGLCKVVTGLNSVFAVNTIVKSLSTYYNNKHFNGPLYGRFKNIFKGKYKENIDTARYAYDINKEVCVTKNIDTMEESNNLEDFEKIEKDFQKALDESLENSTSKESIHSNQSHDEDYKEAILEPNMRDYGNLGMVMEKSDDKLKYIDAYSSIRKSNDNDIRVASYAKLASTYGKNPKKKSNDKNINELNSYARMLKLLSLYGRKIHEGVASKEEQARYLELLYRLGKDFDNDYDITDFLSDEYDRYLEDKERYENQKVYKKAS